MKATSNIQRILWTTLCSISALSIGAVTCVADPCGMVPPIYVGQPPVLARVGEQQTYVFYKDGIETFVIRPGFTGDVDNFGMLIPFPTPPAIRKVPDNIFSQIAAAVDPPEVVLYLHPPQRVLRASDVMAFSKGLKFEKQGKNEVRVLRQEAVGMYEVAVLEAGSAAALKKWMDRNGFRYPTGMDAVCEDYVADDWCFVAVKTKVGQKEGVDPKPGQRKLAPDLPPGASFDGFVQGMGFRFKSDKLVVPMRLSAFNEGELRNIVYLLSDSPQRINSISREVVRRQIPGSRLYRNLTNPLPLRLIGGNEQDIRKWHLEGLAERRNPEPKNGAAKRLFAADLLAAGSDKLSLPQEETEKELLAVGEHFGLRGPAIDKLHAETIKADAEQTVRAGLARIKGMTLTVIDGDFPREVVADENITFAAYEMPALKNKAEAYDAKIRGPAGEKPGVLKLGQATPSQPWWQALSALLIGAGLVLCCRSGSRRIGSTLSVLLLLLLVLPASLRADDVDDDRTELESLLAQLANRDTAKETLGQLAAYSARNEAARQAALESLEKFALGDRAIAKRGWAIAALGEIPGQDVDESLLAIQTASKQPILLRTWAAAARVARVRSAPALIEKADLIAEFPALARPLGKRLVAKLREDSQATSVGDLIALGIKIPAIQQAIAPLILSAGSEQIVSVMFHAEDPNIRRQAAAYLGALAASGDVSVARDVATACAFDPAARTVPWQGGPLFLPALNWQQQQTQASRLVANLIRWHLWCDRHGRVSEQRQIHNNLRSLTLARAAGYQSPGWQEADVIEWLGAWGKAVGRKQLEQILKEQGVRQSSRYQAALADPAAER